MDSEKEKLQSQIQYKLMENLVAEKRLLHSIMHLAGDAIVTADGEGKIISFNLSAERMFGYTPEQVLGANIFLLFNPDSDLVSPAWRSRLLSFGLNSSKDLFEESGFNSGFESLAASGGVVTEMEGVRKSGEYFPTSVSLTAIAYGQKRMFTLIIRDFSDSKKAEKVAIEATRLKSNFLASMSHEIRTPINGIFGMIQLLERSDLDHIQQEQIEVIKRATGNLLTIINDILDISKIESGKTELSVTSFDLEDEIASACSLMQVTAEKKGLWINCMYDQRITNQISADSVKLVQILVNLVGNAIKFTEHGGVDVSINLLHEDSETYEVGFEVRDTGVGISRENFDRIFDTFEQLSHNVDHRVKGSGLGLAISRSYVELMGGSLRVDSQVGSGAKFWFALEFTKGAPIAEKKDFIAPKKDGLSRGLAGMKVLVVEDEEINQLVIGRMLSEIKVEYEIVGAGQIALDRISSGINYDMILMDCQMPGMSGIEATRKIREQHFNSVELPIVAVTAKAMASDLQECLKSGMNAIVTKPIHLDELTNVLREYA